MSGGLPRVAPEVFVVLQQALAPRRRRISLRLTAAAVFGRAQLDEAQLLALTAAIPTAGPMELPRLLPAFDQSGDPTIGAALLDALVVRQGTVERVSRSCCDRASRSIPRRSGRRGDELLATWRSDAARQGKELDALLAGVRGGGDHVRGQMLFNNPKAACNACHAIGYKGGRIGPDLTAIGQIRSERDLLEAIVFPNASFARGFEPVVVTTTTGEAVTGVLKSEGEVIVLVSGRRSGAPHPARRRRRHAARRHLPDAGRLRRTALAAGAGGPARLPEGHPVGSLIRRVSPGPEPRRPDGSVRVQQ